MPKDTVVDTSEEPYPNGADPVAHEPSEKVDSFHELSVKGVRSLNSNASMQARTQTFGEERR